MQVIISEKKKIAVLIIIILSALSLLLALYLFASGKTPFQEDNDYSNIFSECKETVDKNDTSYECLAYLESIESNGKCFTFFFITRDKKLNKQRICQNGIEKKNWNEEILWADYVLPVRVSFLTSHSGILNKVAKVDISVERLQDSELTPFTNLDRGVYSPGNLMTYEIENLYKRGYIYYIVPDSNVGNLYIDSIKIRDITVEAKDFLIKFEFQYEGKDTEFTIKTSDIPFFSKEGESIQMIDEQSYNQLISKENLSMNLTFLKSSSILNTNNVQEMCDSNKSDIPKDCALQKYLFLEDFSKVDDIDKYFENMANSKGIMSNVRLLLIGENE